MEIGKTGRGFKLGKFKDVNGNECSIQDSSLATAAAIWLGISDPYPRCSSEASEEEQQEFIEWHRQYMFDDEQLHSPLVHTRVHLDQVMAANLAETFRMFCKPGNIQKTTSNDYYGLAYSVEFQDNTLLVGPDDPQPQILRPGLGWQPYSYPECTIWTTKMKLDKANVEDLLDALSRFIATGTVGL